MLQNFLILAVCAAATVLAVRLLLIRGIEVLADAMDLSPKAKGQIIGYATSAPEFVVLVSAALAGVFDAGFWNIASSNIINVALFMSAVLFYRQQMEIFSLRFLDEIVFGAVSIAVPLALFWKGVDLTPVVGVGLLSLFLVYRVLDRAFNRTPPEASPSDGLAGSRGAAALGTLLLVIGVGVVIVSGKFLGESAQGLIKEAGTPSWLVGWLLGFITSIPELTSFFEVFRLSKKREQLARKSDMQQALDALVASNMCNLGLILSIGVLVYAVFG